MALYCAGVRSGSVFTNATMAQILSSECVGPQAGIPVILIPCLITQNNSCAGISLAVLANSGGLGFRPARASPGSTPGGQNHGMEDLPQLGKVLASVHFFLEFRKHNRPDNVFRHLLSGRAFHFLRLLGR